MNLIGNQISSLGSNEAEEEKGKSELMSTSLEGENSYRGGGSIKIRSALQIHPSSFTLIKTKTSVPSHIIFVVVNRLLLLNFP